MPYDHRIVVFVLFVGTAVVFVVFSMPALTSGGNQGSSGVSQAEFDAVFTQELAYCRAQPDAINCRCFANRSGIILTYKQPKVRGAVYAEKSALARGQAAQGC